jgi:hypothetical protein
VKAYKNRQGHIVAVFKDDLGFYNIYVRKEENGYFKRASPNYFPKATRAEAESDMETYTYNSYNGPWEKINFGG